MFALPIIVNEGKKYVSVGKEAIFAEIPNTKMLV